MTMLPHSATAQFVPGRIGLAALVSMDGNAQQARSKHAAETVQMSQHWRYCSGTAKVGIAYTLT